VPINDLKPYPINPRRGNVKAIQESLSINGQYRPIVVQQNTNIILAGNHTWLAAKNLGWKEIAVTFIDCDEKSAKKIVLADNRMGDLGSFNDEAIKEILDDLDSWIGTGYTIEEFDKIDGLFVEPLPAIKEEKDSEKPTVAPLSTAEKELLIRIGIYVIEPDEDELKSLCTNTTAEQLKERLGFETHSTKNIQAIEGAPVKISDTEVVPIYSVRPHPDNPREGDVGAISESLKVLGQYRPIVADKMTGNILVGNHTWQAAVYLKWAEISVSWVDVSREQALKILLADNKTADLGSYDDKDLQAILSGLKDFTGTGFDGDDVDEILRGIDAAPLPKTIKVSIGKLSFKVQRKEFQNWQSKLPMSHDQACSVIAERLGLNNYTIRKES
jgi:ParB-like chromosome segregation protein Spo0J